MIELIVSKVAMLLTLGMYSTGIHTVQKIKRRGTGDIPILPFVAMATGCFLWFNYGMMLGDVTLSFTNLVGTILNCAYVLLYYWYTPSKSSVYKTVGAFVLILVTMNFYSSWAHTSTQEATEFVGTIGVCITIATFASPLAQLKVVIEKKNTESMSFPLSVMVAAQCIMWWWYGALINDTYVQFPNICGTILAFIQLGVFFKFWNNKPQSVSGIMQSI